MRTATCLLLVLSVCTCALGYNYFYGTKTDDMELATREKVEYSAFPWKKRIKTFTYTDPQHRPLQAILCYDYQRSEASVNITEGGLGSDHVTLRMKSQRSYRLEYAVEIYV